jgi:hypothetical protein
VARVPRGGVECYAVIAECYAVIAECYAVIGGMSCRGVYFSTEPSRQASKAECYAVVNGI